MISRRPDKDAGLRTAEQFVPAEADNVDPGAQRGRDGGLAAEGVQVVQSPAAQVVGNRYAPAPAQIPPAPRGRPPR